MTVTEAFGRTSLAFDVVEARAELHAAAPTIMLRCRVTEASGTPVHAIALRCQIRIEPQRRRYQPDEEDGLYELFGATAGWGDSLRPFLWTHIATMVPAFHGSTEFELPVECTYDFEVAGTKYLHAVRNGEVPLRLLFSGTTFTRGEVGFAAQPVSWDAEASFRMPVSVWRRVMDLYFPNSAWLRVGRPTFDALQRYKAARALPTWDHAIEALLRQAGEDGP